ncbi:hypothetical protein [Pseudomonas amygdali]|uniref:Uncharacterized protein n=2 Tax=Pseudomonas amygdali pv. lachrymans TaxID=53707 RepID=A0ABR5KS66_PSEAV|nr:hypothetical protein [Pseudomonas amygdali]AXH60250.1 hypothetical protein PLA107_034250 [Pseudomonas amygdali pv. lachrymans str. M301315]KPC17647.1 Uncharacterized protein AC499_0849 [Pseudomonas amygdali pv. lachrymans]
MEISEFYPGLVFNSAGGFEYRCTDVGSRTVLAVLLSGVDPVFVQGPPYIQTEEVFAEHELKQCFLSLADALVQASEPSAHPGFSTDEVKTMIEGRSSPEMLTYSRRNILKADRDLADDVAHPFSISRTDKGIRVRYLTLKSKVFLEMSEIEFAKLPLTTPESLSSRMAGS